MYEYKNVFHFNTFSCWIQDVSYLTVKSILSVALELVHAKYWTGIGFQKICDVTNHATSMIIRNQNPG